MPSRVRKIISGAIRNRTWLAKPCPKGSYVDVGCGRNIRTDWYNVDWFWRSGVDACWDITRGLPIANGHAAGVFSEHCFEHLVFGDFVGVAEELYRILMPGAWIRVIVPDAELYFAEYGKFLNGQPYAMPFQDEDMRRSEGLYSPIFSINRIMRDHEHQFIYDFQAMRAMLENAGFVNIEKKSFGHSNDPMLVQDTEGRSVESLYVEGQRPD